MLDRAADKRSRLGLALRLLFYYYYYYYCYYCCCYYYYYDYYCFNWTLRERAQRMAGACLAMHTDL